MMCEESTYQTFGIYFKSAGQVKCNNDNATASFYGAFNAVS